jgi:hypothetical protein
MNIPVEWKSTKTGEQSEGWLVAVQHPDRALVVVNTTGRLDWTDLTRLQVNFALWNDR